jgi:hypothetical protein
MRMGLTRLDGSLSHNQRSSAMIGQEQPARQTARAPFLATLSQHFVNCAAIARVGQNGVRRDDIHQKLKRGPREFR